MSDLERRLREGRPTVAEPAPGTEERLLRAVVGTAPRAPRSPEGWRRGIPRSRGGRLLGIALLLVGGAAAAALAAGVFDRGPSRSLSASAAPSADWEPPVTLASGISEVPRPKVAMDAGGDTMVAWTGSGITRAAYRPRGGRWTTPTRLSTPGLRAGEVTLAVARDGLSAIAAWRERRDTRLERRVLRFPDGTVAGVINRRVGGDYVLVARHWRADTGWSDAVDVSGAGHNSRDAATPQAVALDSGFLLTWIRADAVEGRSVSVNGTLGALERIAPAGRGDPVDPYLTSDGADALLVWAEREVVTDPGGFSQGTYSVRIAQRGRGGWSAPRRIAEGSVNDPRPTAALTKDGAVAIWTDSSRSRSRVAASRRGAAGAWERPAMISAQGRSAFGPNVGIDGTGLMVAHWSVGGTTQYATARSTGAWSRPAGRGDAGVVGEHQHTVPALAADGAGRLVGVFGARTGPTVRNWPPGGPFGRPSRAIAETGWQYGVAGLAASPTGSAALVVVGFGSTGGNGGWSVRVAVREPADQRHDEAGS